ncbi:hexokinase family protein [Spirochaeta isovalerica]|uniref:Hexokinase n=1 Tax=Spirochaeta isovalerica TaxID=150 RepID=A0A841R7C6_9SPIO|nr:hexokinase [Spirochaeta isovalerica]MBB6478879.1 hexokinase [Spirochaeta isovalerica]
MSEEFTVVKDFLGKMNMFHEQVDMEKAYQHFLTEMEKGLNGEKSSLQMIPTFIESEMEIPVNEKVIVMDAGGTNFRTALIHFDENRQVVIDSFRKSPMPGSDRILTFDEFFDILADSIMDIVEDSGKIGFCFSYPTEITPDKDGRLIKFVKEVQAPEVEGKMIGKSLLERLKSRGVKRDHKIVILNDTVATLLTGKGSAPERNYEDYLGFILGTGLNSCYSESNENIHKLDAIHLDGTHSQIINVESGNLSVPERGKLDKILDEKTSAPGSYFLEKMTSGAYFGALVSEVLFEAEKSDIFDKGFTSELEIAGNLNTRQVNEFLQNPFMKENILTKICDRHHERNRDILYFLIDCMLERAAKLIAVNMAGIILKSGKGESPVRPICLTVDGTTFYAYHKFQFRVEKYLNEFLTGDRKRYYDIIKVEDAPLIGAAIAALTN